MKHININKNKGFSILAIILVIIAVIVAIGIWALSGQTNTSNSSDLKSAVIASSIINESSTIKLAFDTLAINNSNSNNIILIPGIPSTSSKPNIADPANGIQIPKLNSKFLNDNPEPNYGLWMLQYLSNFGYNSKVLMIAGLNESICKQINFQLYGVSTIPEIPLGNNNVKWIYPQYENDENDGIFFTAYLASPYDGKGDINSYNKFGEDLFSNAPSSLCLSLGSLGNEDITYAFYTIVKR